MTFPARRMSKDDRNNFPDYANFPDGSPPVIREFGMDGDPNEVVIADCGGVDYLFYQGFSFPPLSKPQAILRLRGVAFQNPLAAFAFLNGLPSNFCPKAYGFR